MGNGGKPSTDWEHVCQALKTVYSTGREHVFYWVQKGKTGSPWLTVVKPMEKAGAEREFRAVKTGNLATGTVTVGSNDQGRKVLVFSVEEGKYVPLAKFMKVRWKKAGMLERRAAEGEARDLETELKAAKAKQKKAPGKDADKEVERLARELDEATQLAGAIGSAVAKLVALLPPSRVVAGGDLPDATAGTEFSDDELQGADDGEPDEPSEDESESEDAPKPEPKALTPEQMQAIARAATGFREAREEVDGQIEQLRRKLVESGEDDLREIAELGLAGVSSNHAVKVMAALMEIRTASKEKLPAVVERALPLVRRFADHVETAEVVLVVDDNPFDVPVSVRGTLGPALRRLEAALTL